MQHSFAATPLVDDLTQARRGFERWRRTRPRGERIPSLLWSKATSLARDLGVSKVSQALGLDYYALQRRTGHKPERTHTQQAEPGFVELSLPAAAGPARCHVEFADYRGRPMRVELIGMSPQDLASFVRSVSGSEP